MCLNYTQSDRIIALSACLSALPVCLTHFTHLSSIYNVWVTHWDPVTSTGSLYNECVCVCVFVADRLYQRQSKRSTGWKLNKIEYALCFWASPRFKPHIKFPSLLCQSLPCHLRGERVCVVYVFALHNIQSSQASFFLCSLCCWWKRHSLRVQAVLLTSHSVHGNLPVNRDFHYVPLRMLVRGLFVLWSQ